MRFYEVKRVIKAGPDAIWPVLTDKTRLTDGSFSILKIDGEIREGGKIKLWSEADPKRSFGINVSKLAPPREMVWEGGMPFKLFWGRRVFRLTPVKDGTEFHMREDYTGPMAGMIFPKMPDLQPTFDKFATGLARAVEGAGT